MMTVNDDKSITLLLRKPRSKWYSLVCIGRKRHYRRDGSCRHVDELLEQIKPECRHRVKLRAWGGEPARKESAR